jgi:broad specificity phosphatase PhoE
MRVENHRILAAILLLGLTVFGFLSKTYAQEDNGIFTIYLVRHAEKELTTNGSDPALTTCGEQRAEHLGTFLSEVDIEAVYSTDYERTKATARPTAQSKGLLIHEYSDRNLESFSKLLLERKQNALVVGHSHTTGALAGFLAGEGVGHIDLDVYNRIYQVVIHDSIAQLNLFHSSFECQE